MSHQHDADSFILLADNMLRSPISFLLIAGALLTAACDNSPVEPSLTRGSDLPTGGARYSLATTATNGRIAYGFGGNIAVMNPDGTDRIQFTDWSRFPSWSPDGKKLAFSCLEYTSPWDAQMVICTSNPDGTGRVQLTSYPTWDGDDLQPAWSPDGSRIVFARDRNGGGGSYLFDSELWVMNADGSNKVQLPNVAGQKPQWSPDGSKIIFTRFFTSSVWTINADGTQLQELPVAVPGISWVHWSNWSPDGSKIAFTARVDYGFYKLWVMNADGTNIRLLHAASDADYESDWQPSWSPDGRKIVFEVGPTPDGGKLFVIDADGTNLAQIPTEGPDWNTYPAWQPILPETPVYPFTGFFSPLGAAGTLNSVKAGSSVPVKFSLGGDRGLNIFVAGSPSTQSMACTGTVGAQVTIDATNTAGASGVSYDATTGQYTYVLKTEKAWANTCRRLTVRFTDETTHTADFKFN